MKTINFSINEDIAIITIDNPEKRNCLDTDTLYQLDKYVDKVIKSKKIRAAIITGSGNKSFVSGADISEFKHVDISNAKEFSLRGQNLFNKIDYANKPFLAAINGYALGGGFELVLACQFKIATSNAVFGFPEAKLGIIPGYGGTYRIFNEIGKTKGLELLLSAKIIDVSDALKLGIINQLSESDLIDDCITFLKNILANSEVSIQNIMSCINIYRTNFSAEVEAKHFENCFLHNDYMEGVNAFLEKRNPVFKQI